MDAVTYALLSGKLRAIDEKVDGLGEGFNYLGTVATVGDLPNDATAGDMYTVSGADNMRYVYDGASWINLDENIVDLSGEVTTLKNALTDLEIEKAPVIIATVSGSVAEINDDAAEFPIKKITAQIMPVQSDSGDVRPISGWTGSNITIRKNLYDGTIGTNNYYLKKGGTRNASISWCYTDILPIEPDTVYSISGMNVGASIVAGLWFYHNNAYTSGLQYDGANKITFRTPSICEGIRFSINKVNGAVPNVQFEKGEATPYTPYGSPVSIDWSEVAGTVYAGDATFNEDGSANIVSTMGNIASYNGESINEPWLSSLDVYEPGATPTTGAQVVYTLSTPEEYHVEGLGQQTLHGGTYFISANTGDVIVDYAADTRLYIANALDKSNKAEESCLLKKRRATASFIFDDGYTKDVYIKAIFDSVGKKCGFAIYSIANRYIQYAREGFEILAHASSPIENPTEALVRTQLNNAYTTIANGIGKCFGWVTPSSELAAEFRPLVYDYYEYGYTIYKGNVSTPEDVVMPKTLKSYGLWRSSLQSLTLAECKAIVDYAYANNQMICFYGHASALDGGHDNLTTANLIALLEYCDSVGVEVVTPHESVKNFFAYRHNEDS